VNGVAAWDPARQERLFARAQDQMGLPAPIIEKDFWVCWTLKQLFSIPELEGWLTFKGGTSLSKCFDLIQRFSEDIDLAVDFERLGYIGENDPRRPDLSHGKRHVLLDEMMGSCLEYIAGPLYRAMAHHITSILGPDGWSLTVSTSNADVLLFEYPRAVSEGLDYIVPAVVLEFGTHAEPVPCADSAVTPFAAEQFPGVFTEPVATIRTVVARRTFWEKATILHTEYHRPLVKPLPPRYSRHYADVAMMAQAAVKDEALADLDLLHSVCVHKDRFYHCGWARYLEAKPGSFHLLPRRDRLSALRRHYQAMQVMFFAEPPPFDQVLGVLERLEMEINGL